MLPATTKKQEIVNILVVFYLLVTYNLQTFITNVLDFTVVSRWRYRHSAQLP